MADTHGLWKTTAAPIRPFPSLSSAVKAEVAIIGGGYGGLSAALRLAEIGVDVVLIEAEEIGFGGAGRGMADAHGCSMGRRASGEGGGTRLSAVTSRGACGYGGVQAMREWEKRGRRQQPRRHAAEATRSRSM